MRSTIKVLSICCLGLSLLAPHLALGHENHGAPLDDTQAIEKATEYTKMIIEKPELVQGLDLDASWQSVAETSIYRKDLRYFIVSLHNASQEKTLYILLDSYGEFYGANYDGTFEGL